MLLVVLWYYIAHAYVSRQLGIYLAPSTFQGCHPIGSPPTPKGASPLDLQAQQLHLSPKVPTPWTYRLMVYLGLA